MGIFGPSVGNQATAAELRDKEGDRTTGRTKVTGVKREDVFIYVRCPICFGSGKETKEASALTHAKSFAGNEPVVYEQFHSPCKSSWCHKGKTWILKREVLEMEKNRSLSYDKPFPKNFKIR